MCTHQCRHSGLCAHSRHSGIIFKHALHHPTGLDQTGSAEPQDVADRYLSRSSAGSSYSQDPAFNETTKSLTDSSITVTSPVANQYEKKKRNSKLSISSSFSDVTESQMSSPVLRNINLPDEHAITRGGIDIDTTLDTLDSINLRSSLDARPSSTPVVGSSKSGSPISKSVSIQSVGKIGFAPSTSADSSFDNCEGTQGIPSAAQPTMNGVLEEELGLDITSDWFGGLPKVHEQEAGGKETSVTAELDATSVTRGFGDSFGSNSNTLSEGIADATLLADATGHGTTRTRGSTTSIVSLPLQESVHHVGVALDASGNADINAHDSTDAAGTVVGDTAELKCT